MPRDAKAAPISTRPPNTTTTMKNTTSAHRSQRDSPTDGLWKGTIDISVSPAKPGHTSGGGPVGVVHRQGLAVRWRLILQDVKGPPLHLVVNPADVLADQAE